MTAASRLPPLSVAQRITMCGQIALGMEHIAERGLTHRDLAARNILLMPSLHLKVNIFILSIQERSVRPIDYRSVVIH